MAYHDQALLVHDDERGDIYRIGLPTENKGPVIDLMYRMGDPRIKADFEGIAVYGGSVYVTTSRGVLYSFPVAQTGVVSPEVIATGLADVCEVEGLANDEAGLVIACKEHYVAPQDASVIYHFDPVTRALEQLMVLDQHVALSAIELDGDTVSMLAARQYLLLTVNGSGQTIAQVALNPDRHPQPEGLAITPEGDTWIADEDAGGGRLTVYGR